MPRRKLVDELHLRALIEADLRTGKLSVYAIAQKHHTSYNTVRRYRDTLKREVPPHS